MWHLNNEQLEAGLDYIKKSPKDNGVLHLIVGAQKLVNVRR